MIADLRIVDDVPSAFAELVARAISDQRQSARHDRPEPFRLGCSGGTSGTRCVEALGRTQNVDWSHVACYFADERCVEPMSRDANVTLIKEALGGHVGELAGFYPMSCGEGPAAYEALLRKATAIDVLQLGFGPDGHTASLFANSLALTAPTERLVARNFDPSGRNPFDRLTLTYSGIALSRLVVLTVIGKEKAEALRFVDDGGNLPAARVRAHQVIWLCDRGAASHLAPREGT
jgi:6-phosphogluconolactonase/glucosamine-6-phosphate isomerase/deaminase